MNLACPAVDPLGDDALEALPLGRVGIALVIIVLALTLGEVAEGEEIGAEEEEDEDEEDAAAAEAEDDEEEEAAAA